MSTPGIDSIGVCVPFYCHDGNEKFLLHKRSDQCRDERGAWDSGGGQLDLHEDPRVGVLREVREEYGCDGVIEKQLLSYSIHRRLDGKPTHWIAVPFLIRGRPEEVKINEPEKRVDLGWFPLKDFPHPLHPGVILALERFRTEFESI